MWTSENRCHYHRGHLRYERDLTDEEWVETEPRIAPAKPGGNKRTANLREVINGTMYLLTNGCQRRAIPKDLPLESTIQGYLDRWGDDGTLHRLYHVRYLEWRERMCRRASPTAAIIDSQSVRLT
jgi:transposase